MIASIELMAAALLININPGRGFGVIKQGAPAEGRSMNAGWKVLWLSAATLGVAFGAERLLVPDIVPIAFAEAPQPQWAVQLAFFLRTVELLTAAVAIIALVLTLGAWAKGRPRGGAL